MYLAAVRKKKGIYPLIRPRQTFDLTKTKAVCLTYADFDAFNMFTYDVHENWATTSKNAYKIQQYEPRS
jgi:hypothetical protein